MNKKIKLFVSVLAVVSILSVMAIATFATAPEMDTSFVQTVTGQLSAFSATNLGVILVAALGITVTLALAWFAYRFITRRVSKAMRKGSL